MGSIRLYDLEDLLGHDVYNGTEFTLDGIDYIVDDITGDWVVYVEKHV